MAIISKQNLFLSQPMKFYFCFSYLFSFVLPKREGKSVRSWVGVFLLAKDLLAPWKCKQNLNLALVLFMCVFLQKQVYPLSLGIWPPLLNHGVGICFFLYYPFSYQCVWELKVCLLLILDCITALLQFCHAINDVISSLVIASIINSEA